MYENVLFQNAVPLLERDIKSGRLPRAILFSGGECCGKLTTALETARVISCAASSRGKPFGQWNCSCPSCQKHRALVSQNLMLLGPRDCTLEIKAAKKAFASSCALGDSHVNATRFLFLRSVRKLEARFSPILFAGSDKLSKIAALTSEIDELMEELDVEHELPEAKKVDELAQKISDACQKLEGDFLYDSIPILQIRNLSEWAHIGAAEGKKAIIIERAERMPEGARNALLKILEEPPEETLFILTTRARNAVMPTILSRVRTYNFSSRNLEQSKEIIDRVFHDGAECEIKNYLETFLPVTPEAVSQVAKNFLAEILSGAIPDVSETIKKCGKFEPRILFNIFLDSILNFLRASFESAGGTQAALECKEHVQNCYNNVSTYNQGIQAALEELVRNIASTNKRHVNQLKIA